VIRVLGDFAAITVLVLYLECDEVDLDIVRYCPFLLGILLSAINISNVLACRVFSTSISFSQLFDNLFCIVSFSCEVC